jgi:predicted ATPase
MPSRRSWAGSRTAPSRQQTLRATLEWSFRLLTRAAQTLFSRLAVFAGGFDFETAAAMHDEQEHEVAVVGAFRISPLPT